jgi:hypothetical protein
MSQNTTSIDDLPSSTSATQMPLQIQNPTQPQQSQQPQMNLQQPTQPQQSQQPQMNLQQPTQPQQPQMNLQQPTQPQTPMVPAGQPAISNDVIQQIISGIQQADTHGATALPSRFTTQDIQHFAQDEQVKPNYIPKASGVDMENKRKHENFEDNPEIYEKRIRKKQKERIMDEIQKPLIVAVFIMFSHLPIVARVMYKHFPGLYESQGSLNTGGLLFIALLFSAFYYVFVKVTEYLAEE